MAKQLDIVPGGTKLTVAKSTVGGLGGSIGVRITIDDGVVLAKSDARRLIQTVQQAILEDAWPLA